jgi:hypothetical protein
MKQFVKILTLLGVAGSVVMAQTPHPQNSTSYVAADRLQFRRQRLRRVVRTNSRSSHQSC